MLGNGLTDINNKLSEGTNLTEKVKYLAQTREALFDVLRNDIAEGQGETRDELKQGDEKTLAQIKNKLEIKRQNATNKIGKEQGTNRYYSLRDNNALDTLRRDQANQLDHTQEFNHNEDVRQEAEDTIAELDKIQRKENQRAGTTGYQENPNLFRNEKTQRWETIENILQSNENNTTKINNINTLISRLGSFDIRSSATGLKESNHRKIAKRAGVALHIIKYICRHYPIVIPATQKSILSKRITQIKKQEIPAIRTIHNVDQELRRVEPLHTILEEMNEFVQPDFADTTSIETGTDVTRDMESMFVENDNKKSAGIDKYSITRIATDNTNVDINFKNIQDEDVTHTSIDKGPDAEVSRKIIVTINNKEGELGTIHMTNEDKKGEIHFTPTDIDILKQVFTDDEMQEIGGMAVTMDIHAVKNASFGSKAARTKHRTINIADDITANTTNEEGEDGDEDDDTTENNNEENTNPIPDLEDTAEITASISNLRSSRQLDADRQAAEHLRERYANLPRWSPDRINIFLRRKFIKKNLTDKYLNKYKGLHYNDKDQSITDRHQIEREEGLVQDQNIMDLTETQYPQAYRAINELSQNYVGTRPYTQTTMTQDEFMTAFKDILFRDPPLDNRRPSLKKLLRKQKMEDMGTNVRLRVDKFQKHQALVHNLMDHINNNPTMSGDELATYARPKIKDYVANYNSMPAFLKTLRINMDNPQHFETLLRLQQSERALTHIATQTLRMKIQLITKGEAAHDNKQKRGFFSKVGDFVDGKRAQKIRNKYIREAVGRVRAGTKFTVLAGGTVAGMFGGGPLLAAGITGGVVGLKTFFSKYAHYTEEHEGQLKNRAVNVGLSQQERTRLDGTVGGRWQSLLRFGLGQKGRDRRYRERYQRTMHGDIILSKTLSTNLKNNLNKEVLTDNERTILERQTYEALARIDMYHTHKQSFVGSDNYEHAEQEYHKLHQAAIAGADRLGIDMSQRRNNTQYNTVIDRLKSQYDQAQQRFKNKKRKVGIASGIATGAIAGGLSYGASHAASFIKDKVGDIFDTDNTNVLKNEDYEFQPGGHQEPNLLNGDMSIDLQNGITNGLNSGDIITGANGSEIRFSYFPGIDELPTKAGAFNLTTLQDKIQDILTSSEYQHLSQTNQNIIKNALDINNNTSGVNKMLEHAANHGGVDIGNQYLFAMRGVESIETMVDQMSNNGLTNNPLQLTFDPDKATVNTSVVGSSGDVDDRHMNALAQFVNDSADGKGKNITVGIPLVNNTFKRPSGNVGLPPNNQND